AWILIVVALLAAPCARAQDAAFQRWLEELWPEAQRLGISRETFETTTRGLTPNLKLPDLVPPGRADRPPAGQAEFLQAPADYVRESTIANRAGQGRRLAVEHRSTLAAIEQKFGVPGNIILAIWGRETAYGGHKLPHNAITVLATQAYLGRRKEMFRQEFL